MLALLVAIALVRSVAAADPPLVLLAQPLPSDERTAENLQPFARYLETITARAWIVEMPPTFPAYWEAVRRNNYDVALDASHFTDYRLQKLGFHVLAKSPDTASYTLIVRATGAVLDPALLVGKRIASLGLLSLGALRLNAIFPNPVRQPVLVDARNARAAIELLLGNKAEAAFVPTTAVPKRAREKEIAVVLTTEPLYRLAISASPRLTGELRESVRDGVLAAHESDLGRAALDAAGLLRFEPATAEDFLNQGNVLKGYWGY